MNKRVGALSVYRLYAMSKSGIERSIRKHLIFYLAEQVNVGLWELYWRDHAAIDLSKGTA